MRAQFKMKLQAVYQMSVCRPELCESICLSHDMINVGSVHAMLVAKGMPVSTSFTPHALVFLRFIRISGQSTP